MKSALRPWTVEVKSFEGPPTVGRFMGSVNYLISMEQTPHRKTGVKNTGGNGHCICMYIYIHIHVFMLKSLCDDLYLMLADLIHAFVCYIEK